MFFSSQVSVFPHNLTGEMEKMISWKALVAFDVTDDALTQDLDQNFPFTLRNACYQILLFPQRNVLLIIYVFYKLVLFTKYFL